MRVIWFLLSSSIKREPVRYFVEGDGVVVVAGGEAVGAVVVLPGGEVVCGSVRSVLVRDVPDCGGPLRS